MPKSNEKNQDVRLKEILTYVSSGKYEDSVSPNEKNGLRKTAKKFKLIDGRLHYIANADKPRLVLFNKEEREKVLTNLHNGVEGAHQGIVRTQDKVKRSFYWLTITADVEQWIKTCKQCQHSEQIRVVAPQLHPIKVAERWDVVGIDLIGPFRQTAKGNTYVLTMTDLFTKWIVARPIPNKTSSAVAEVLVDTFYTFGPPRRIISDQGREFVSQLNEEILQLFGVQHSVTSAYHPQSNGQDERTNQTIKRALMKYINDAQDDWDKYICSITYGLIISKQKSTKMTPFYIMYLRNPWAVEALQTVNSSDEMLNNMECATDSLELDTLIETCKNVELKVRANIDCAQQKQRLHHDKQVKKGAKAFSLKVGDSVMKFNARKRGRKGDPLSKQWTGPFKIHSISLKGQCQIADENGDVLKQTVNICHLKPFYRQQTTDLCANGSATESACYANKSDDPIPGQPTSTAADVNTLNDQSPNVSVLDNRPDDRIPIQPASSTANVNTLNDQLPDVSVEDNLPDDQIPIQPASSTASMNNFNDQLPITSTSGKPVPGKVVHNDSSQRKRRVVPTNKGSKEQPFVQIPVKITGNCGEAVNSNASKRKSTASSSSTVMKTISSGRMLTDIEINAAQNLMKTQFQLLYGLQETLLGNNLSFDIQKEPMIQILHNGSLHWIAISTFGCEDGCVKLFDSMKRTSVPMNVQMQIASLLYCDKNEITVHYQPCQQQVGGVDCGLFAIAFCVDLCLGNDPCTIQYNQSAMRTHLMQCLTNNCFSCFPRAVGSTSRKCGGHFVKIPIYCSCRLPDNRAEKMVQCDNCSEWYHVSCDKIPKDAIGSNKAWTCRSCLAKGSSTCYEGADFEGDDDDSECYQETAGIENTYSADTKDECSFENLGLSKPPLAPLGKFIPESYHRFVSSKILRTCAVNSFQDQELIEKTYPGRFREFIITTFLQDKYTVPQMNEMGEKSKEILDTNVFNILCDYAHWPQLFQPSAYDK